MQPGPVPRRLARALAACSMLTLAIQPAVAAAPALPAGLSVAAGQAQVSTSGNRMTVVNTPQAILNWNSFSIGSGAAVYFQQASAASSVLNRVTGNDPSSILGSLGSNGRVWLLNPNGVIFGQGARVDVAGLVASTLRLNDSDWLAGHYRLTAADAGGAQVLNQGELRSSFGGTIALLGDSVSNEGVLQADGGQIILAAGKSIELIDTGAPTLGVRISAAAGEARNLGSLQAAGGRIDIHAAAVNQQGIVSADGFAAGPGGEIWIKASQSVELGGGSRSSADGAAGGSVHVQADAGRSSLHGTVSAQGSAGAGGQVALLGREVGLLDAASVDVSGAAGGGSVVVGGGLRGQDLRYANAQAVYFGPQARITADATRDGSGGSIVLWSDKATRAFGSLSVRGGALGGDGGFIETSGGWLDARPSRIDTSAARGRSGQWLLDPFNLEISDFAADQGTDANFNAIASNASIPAGRIFDALQNGTSVTVTTGATGSEPGHITISNATIVTTSATPGSLTVIADGNLTISNSDIGSGNSSAEMALTFRAGRTSGGLLQISNSTISTTGVDFFVPTAQAPTPAVPPMQLAGSSQILIGGFATGSLPFGGSFTGAGGGVTLSGSTVSARSGSDVLIYGAAPSGAGVFFDNSFVSGHQVDIRGSSGSFYGVIVANNTSISADRTLSIQGLGFLTGISIVGSSSVYVIPSAPDATASLTLQGRSTVSEGGSGVTVSSLSASFPNVEVGNGASMLIEASSAGSPQSILIEGTGVHVIDGTGGGTVTLRDHDGTGGIGIDGSAVVGGNGLMRLQGASVQLLNNASLTAVGRITAGADSFDFGDFTTITSSATGDAVVLSGSGTTPTLDFQNTGNGLSISAPNGRFIVYAQSPAAPNWSPGSLVHDFKRHGSTFGGWSADVGNGFAFAQAQTAQFIAAIGTRPYNQTVAAPLGNVTVTNISASGDIGALKSNVTARYADPHAGVNKPATFNQAVAFEFFDSQSKPVYGYTVTAAPTAPFRGTVTPLTVFGTPTIATRVYDGSLNATATVPALSGLFGSETLTASGTATYVDKNVGVGKQVAAVSIALGDGASGGLARNYVYAQSSVEGLVGTVTPRAISVGGLIANNKIYDGSRAASVSGVPVFTPVQGDVLTVSGSPQASFADKNVGNAKSVTVTGLGLGGPDAANYSFSSSATLSASILPRPVDLSGISALSRDYDGTTAAQLAGVPTLTAVAGDDVAFSGTLTGRFADKNVGTGKAVSLSGATLTGADAANYTLTQPAALRADITALGVAVQGLSAANKVYDGGTAAQLSGTARVATLTGDLVSLGGTSVGNFVDKNVGTSKPVTVTGYTLVGADAANYALTQPLGLRADITPLGLTVTGLSALNKIYDATTAAALSGTAAVATLAGDLVALGGTISSSFADKNVGSAKPVTVSGYTLGGADATNYTLSQPQGLSASISPLAVSVSGVSIVSRVYDGGSAAALSGTARAGTLAGDLVNLGGTAVASFASKTVGSNKPVTVTGYTLSGSDAANYRLGQPQGLSASITALSLPVTGLGAQNKVYDGNSAAALSGTARVSPLAGDDVSLRGTGVGSFADRNVGTGKPVGVAGYSIGGADAANYSLVAPQGLSASITPATLLYVASTEVRTFGAPLDGLGGRVTGLVGGDTLATATQGAAVFRAVATPGAPAGTYAVAGSGLSAANYSFAQAPGNASALSIIDLSAQTSSVIGAERAVDNGFSANSFVQNAGRERADAGFFNALSDTGALGGPAQPNGNFGAVRLSSLSPGEVQALLAGRRLFMQNLLGESSARLERNPALADLQECQTLEEARKGTCVVTASFKSRLKPGEAVTVAAAPLAPAQAAAATPAAAAAATAAITPAPAPAPAAAVAVAPAPAPERVAVAPPTVVPRADFSVSKRKVRSAALPQIERKIALVVGVDRYQDSSIPSLNNAVSDARAVARIFESKLGYETVVLDNATRGNLVAALNQLALTVGPRDSVVVYYAGHGELVETTKLGYWLLADSVAKQPETWLSNTDISKLIAQIGASQVALVSDSCYSGSLASEERIRALAGTLDPKQVLDRKSVVVMSSGGNEPVFDEGKNGHSPFAWSLMNTLGQVSNWQAGGNVFERVRFAVARALPQRPQYSASRAAGHQPGGDYLFEQRQFESPL